jgi:preprotein translocase subunit SecA
MRAAAALAPVDDDGGGAPVPEEPLVNVPVVKDEHAKVGRNDPCWCGSGQKFKHCHGR